MDSPRLESPRTESARLESPRLEPPPSSRETPRLETPRESAVLRLVPKGFHHEETSMGGTCGLSQLLLLDESMGGEGGGVGIPSP